MYNPDFVNPPPGSPLAEFEDELATMVATPAAQIAAEVRYAYGGAELPPVLEPFLSEPKKSIEALAELMREYWARCHAEHWPRVRSLLEHDVLHRSRQIADGGTARLFCDLDPSGELERGSAADRVRRVRVTTSTSTSAGLLLVPSVFVWPKVTILTLEPWQPTLRLPGAGHRHALEPRRVAARRTRSSGWWDAPARLLLTALDSPRSTTELAGELGLTPGGVSQHLDRAARRRARLRPRVARSVLYLRSAEGDALLDASGGGRGGGGARSSRSAAAAAR